MEAGEGCEDMVSGCSFYIFSLSFSAFNFVLLFVCAHMMVCLLCKTTLVNVGIKRMILKMIMQLLIKWCSIPGVSFMHQVSKYTHKLTSLLYLFQMLILIV